MLEVRGKATGGVVFQRLESSLQDSLCIVKYLTRHLASSTSGRHIVKTLKMSTTTATLTQREEPLVVAARAPEARSGAFDGLTGADQYGDFRDELARNGFAVIKGAIPRERADQYADKMFTYLEELFVLSSVQNGHC